MARLLFISLLLFSFAFVGAQVASYNLLNQTNGYTLYFDLTNRLECHNYTDVWGYPLICVADDFVLPAFLGLDMTRVCNGLLFNFTTIRLKVDMDPNSITIRLFSHNTTSGTPTNSAFFTRTMCSPDNTCVWPSRLNVPAVTTIALNNGDLDDNGVTAFDLSKLPSGQTLWVSIYVSVPDHPSTSILRENSLYWMTLDNKSTSTPLQQRFYDGTPNYNYKYIDVNNFHRNNFTSWTDASIVQPVLGVYTTTFNMAWTVSLVCQSGTTFLLSFPPTLSPTESPTTMIPTSVPTQAPSNGPTQSPTMIPTSEPTSEPTNEPTVIVLTPNETVNSNNETRWYDPYLQNQQIVMYTLAGLTLFLFSVCCCVCLCIKCYRYRKKTGRLSINAFLGKYKSDSEIEMGTIATSYSDFREEQRQNDQNYEQVAKKRNLPPKRQSWTSKETYTTVSLSDQDESLLLNDADNQGQLAHWVNDIMPSNTSIITASDTTKKII